MIAKQAILGISTFHGHSDKSQINGNSMYANRYCKQQIMEVILAFRRRVLANSTNDGDLTSLVERALAQCKG